MKRTLVTVSSLLMLLGVYFCSVLNAQDVQPKVGQRPYEMVWANRTADDHPAVWDFESPDVGGSWNVASLDNSWKNPAGVATFERSREQQLFGDWVGKLTYRGGSHVTVRLQKPIPIPGVSTTSPLDTLSIWVYGNKWSWEHDSSTPGVQLAIVLKSDVGPEWEIPLFHVNWKEWFLIYIPLNDAQKQKINEPGSSIVGIRVNGGTNAEDRVLYFDSLCVFKEEWKPLTFLPRPKRPLDLTGLQDQGTNTGAAPDDVIQVLPFPNRPETILPDSQADGSKNEVKAITTADYKPGFELTYTGSDGTLVYRYVPNSGTWSDITASWNQSAPITILADGGVTTMVANSGAAESITKRELVKAEIVGEGKTVQAVWKLFGNGNNPAVIEVTYKYTIKGKSLVIDTFCPKDDRIGGRVEYVSYGGCDVTKLEGAKVTTVPYLSYGYSGSGRPGIVSFRSNGTGLFLSGMTDWYVSNASELSGRAELTNGKAFYNGSTHYRQKVGGARNACFDRFYVTLSPVFEEVLPTIPNPISPWKHVTGTKLWRAHGASTRDGDKKYWRNVWRHGMRDVIVTDHEVCWRDGGESYTFRTKPAPGKGGDEGWIDYSRFMQKELGFVYGPYNNFTDFAPVNEFWSADMCNRFPDRRFRISWSRCYAPKPSRGVEFCAWQAPLNQKKFNFSCAYCDVHTAVTPWERTDYDYRVPGAGTFAATYYAYGEILLRQKMAWNGPVYSEGPMMYLYAGLTDGNYAQDQSYKFPVNPWIVDFDLRKIHPHENNFGMGNLDMYGGWGFSKPKDEAGLDACSDRFTAATAAFGHPGFLLLGEVGMPRAWRNYFLLQQIQSRYCQTEVKSICYVTDDGKQVSSSEAILTDVYKDSRIVTVYQDGTTVVVNGSLNKRLKTTVDGKEIDLPPSAWTAWYKSDNPTEQIESFSGDVYHSTALNGRADYAVSPKYIYADGRGKEVCFPTVKTNGPALCRFIDAKTAEIILLNGATAGFKIDAVSAIALDFDGNELGPAELVNDNGFVSVKPVEKAFSYRVTLK